MDGPHQIGTIPMSPIDVHSGIVGAAVVHDDDLQSIARIRGPRTSIDRLFDHRPFVVGRNDNGQPRRVGDAHGGKRTIADPEQGANHEEQHPHGEPEQTRTGDDRRPPLDHERLGERIEDFMAEANRGGDHRSKENDGRDDKAKIDCTPVGALIR